MKLIKTALAATILSTSLFSNVLDKVSYYIAYDENDATQYALIMPSVNKIYTHKAGDLLNLHLIDSLSAFPSYSNGQVCFPSLQTGSTGEFGASTMAGKCYTTNFFYIQKEVVSDGYSFLLYYKPANKLYEGLAGQSASFKVVRDENGVYNNESISNEDYTNFKFDLTASKVLIGDDALSVENPPSQPDLNTTDSNTTTSTPPIVPTI